jgi:hypothetical protein
MTVMDKADGSCLNGLAMLPQKIHTPIPDIR